MSEKGMRQCPHLFHCHKGLVLWDKGGWDRTHIICTNHFERCTIYQNFQREIKEKFR